MLIECKNCSAVVDAVEHGDYVYDRPDIDPWKYTLVSCPRCKHPMLAEQEYDYGPPDFEWSTADRVYPAEDIQPNSSWPNAIQSAFQEAVVCRKSKAYTAATIMCRKALEGMCMEHGYTKKDLKKRLLLMKDAGIIESRLFDWADALRLLGNEAAHGVTVVFSSQDASDALDFTEAILEYVFTFREKFDRFMERRNTA